MTSPVFGSIEEYLGDFSGEMAARVEEGSDPLFDPERDAFSPEVMDVLERPGRFPAPYPAQAVTLEGLLRASGRLHSLDLTGEMGCGKTPLGCWFARCLAKRWGRPLRIVVTCPNQLVKKWRAHFQKILDGAHVVIVTGVADLVHLRSAGKPLVNEVYIIARDKGKLSYAWKPAALRSPVRVSGKDTTGRPFSFTSQRYRCPRCGTIQTYTEKGQVVEAGLEYFGKDGRPSTRRYCCGNREVLTRTYRDKSGELRGDWEAVPCMEPLWNAYNGEPGRRYVCAPRGPGRWVHEKHDRNRMPKPGIAPRRMSPAEFIWRYNIRFDLYIPDEVHELSGEGSLQGRMYGWLAARSRKVLNATGTLSGGYASNLLFRLWRTAPQRLRGDGLEYNEDGFSEFVKMYGVLQVERKYVADHPGQSVEDLCLGRGKLISKREKALPGISPLLYAHHLLAQSAFVRLREMYAHLPTFDETVHVVGMTIEQTEALIGMSRKFEAHQRKQRASGVPCRAWAGARAVFLRWPDRPWPCQRVYDRDKQGSEIVAFDVPELPENVEYPKEKKLAELVRAQLDRGRKSWIFTEMTGDRWDVTARLVNYLARHGVRAAVLRTQQNGGPKPEDREEWIARHSPNNDVIISNPGLVKTGLDLYDFPNIIFYYCGDSTYTLRQASRRAWRLGQLQPCEVHYLVYGGLDESVTKAALQLRLARQALGGDPDDEESQVAADGYTCLQSAALSLMAKKMEASLALEGEFTSEGLASMAESTDMQSALAKVIAGKLQVGDPREAFASYRKKLEALMPSIVKQEGAEDAGEPEHGGRNERAGEGAPAGGVAAAGESGAPADGAGEAADPVGADPAGDTGPGGAGPVVPEPARVTPREPVRDPARSGTARRRKSLTGLLALAEMLEKDNPAVARQLAADVRALTRSVR